jgi:hypothetical protein
LPQIVPSLEARQAMFSQRPKVCSLIVIVIGQAGYVEVFFFRRAILGEGMAVHADAQLWTVYQESMIFDQFKVFLEGASLLPALLLPRVGLCRGAPMRTKPLPQAAG